MRQEGEAGCYAVIVSWYSIYNHQDSRSNLLMRMMLCMMSPQQGFIQWASWCGLIEPCVGCLEQYLSWIYVQSKVYVCIEAVGMWRHVRWVMLDTYLNALHVSSAGAGCVWMGVWDVIALVGPSGVAESWHYPNPRKGFIHLCHSLSYHQSGCRCISCLGVIVTSKAFVARVQDMRWFVPCELCGILDVPTFLYTCVRFPQHPVFTNI